ncbi:CPBP family intramembrane metalloprotease [Sporosarcina oncorhynchi]|uniref:CPBP family intramembrane metalloprotease n=1 Tax=Sporosarcina oncorhynchi TaxID=3056444 RepID=A0ABZ0L5C3_9BACL|nr:CPBP family intramembrane glutamic endopeptidase [Sporosarcina sp. T2O-4]WOV87774.1 CPBP family intramembrane metalloprotease [Sporosarcina sp. T2O-4]
MFKNERNQVRAGWLILITFVTMFIAQQVFALPGVFALMVVDFSSLSTGSEAEVLNAFDRHPWVFLLSQGGGTIGGMLITVLLWKFMNKRTLKELGFRGPLKDLGFGLLLGALSIFIIFVLLYVTGNIELLNTFSTPEFSIYTITFLILFILVGFFEEMFFRGYVMSTMANRGNSRWLMYVVSAIIFSLAHGMNPNVSILGLVNIALVGVLFAYMFIATNSLWLPIGYHITWNYFQGNVFGFAVSGLSPHGIYNVSVEGGNDLLTGGAFGLEGGLLATLLIVLGYFATRFYAKNRKHT